MEVDLILTDTGLMVSHELGTVHAFRTLETLYLDPISIGIKTGVIPDEIPFSLLLDIKTEAYSTIDAVLDVVKKYESFMYSPTNTGGLKLVISGRKPSSEHYTNYPDYIFFDHQSLDNLEKVPFEKVEMFSFPFKNVSAWNGKGRIVEEENTRLKDLISKVHNLEKPIRFWATPDSKSAWKALRDLGVDYINTDVPFLANYYLMDLESRVVHNSIKSDIINLDFSVDGAHQKVENIILLIGDGNGLAQISSGMYANGNSLNMTNLKSLGLLKTQSSDDFTTDSASGGTALATGNKTHNRGISMNSEGVKFKSLTVHLSELQFSTGIITTDNITGATPSAFYAHQKDRDNIQAISMDLSKSPLDLFIGAGKNDFLRYQNHALDSLITNGFLIAQSLNQVKGILDHRVGYFASHHGLPSVNKGREGFLKKSLEVALSNFSSRNKPFFLMVENGHIDNNGHSNHAQNIVDEVIDFDQAVAVALNFAQTNQNTLVLITADHETSGLSIPQGNIEKQEVELEFTSDDHTGIMVPIFAYGPHSLEFSGVYENTEVFHKIMKLIELYHSLK